MSIFLPFETSEEDIIVEKIDELIRFNEKIIFQHINTVYFSVKLIQSHHQGVVRKKKIWILYIILHWTTFYSDYSLTEVPREMIETLQGPIEEFFLNEDEEKLFKNVCIMLNQ